MGYDDSFSVDPVSVFNPVATLLGGAGEIGIAITINISPLGEGWVSSDRDAPSLLEESEILEGVSVSGLDESPMVSLDVIAEHIGLAISVDISPVGVGSSVRAPSGSDDTELSEGSVSVGESNPMSTGSVIAVDVGLSVTVDISPLGLGTGVSAPSGELQSEVLEGSVSVGKLEPMSSGLIVADHVGLSVTVDISPVSPGTSMGAPSFGNNSEVLQVTSTERKLNPVSTGVVVTDEVILSISVDIGVLDV